MQFSIFISFLFVFRSEEKLVELVYSWFRRRATSMFKTISVFTNNGSEINQAECK